MYLSSTNIDDRFDPIIHLVVAQLISRPIFDICRILYKMVCSQDIKGKLSEEELSVLLYGHDVQVVMNVDADTANKYCPENQTNDDYVSASFEQYFQNNMIPPLQVIKEDYTS
jgi:hypothetical protein